MRFIDLLTKAAKKKKKKASQRKRAPKPSHVKINPACVSGPLPCCSGKCFHPGQGKGDSVSSLVITARSSIQCHANPVTSAILTRGLWGKLRPREEKELARGHSGHRTEKELPWGSSKWWSLEPLSLRPSLPALRTITVYHFPSQKYVGAKSGRMCIGCGEG